MGEGSFEGGLHYETCCLHEDTKLSPIYATLKLSTGVSGGVFTPWWWFFSS